MFPNDLGGEPGDQAIVLAERVLERLGGEAGDFPWETMISCLSLCGHYPRNQKIVAIFSQAPKKVWETVDLDRLAAFFVKAVYSPKWDLEPFEQLLENLPEGRASIMRLVLRQVIKTQKDMLDAIQPGEQEDLAGLYQVLEKKWRALAEAERPTVLSLDDVVAIFQQGESVRTGLARNAARRIQAQYAESAAPAMRGLIEGTADETVMAAVDKLVVEDRSCHSGLETLVKIKPALLGQRDAGQPLWTKMMGKTIDKEIIPELVTAVYPEDRQAFIRDVVTYFGTEYLGRFGISESEPEVVQLRGVEWEVSDESDA